MMEHKNLFTGKKDHSLRKLYEEYTMWESKGDETLSGTDLKYIMNRYYQMNLHRPILEMENDLLREIANRWTNKGNKFVVKEIYEIKKGDFRCLLEWGQRIKIQMSSGYVYEGIIGKISEGSQLIQLYLENDEEISVLLDDVINVFPI